MAARRTDVTVVLETRMRDGLKWRRLRTPAQRTYWTVELPETVVKGTMTAQQLEQRMAQWLSGEKKRERIAQIKALALQGVKTAAIASMFPEISDRNVMKYCAEALKEKSDG